MRKRPWLTPVLILGVILIPLIFAVIVFVRPAWFALGHTNHGQLVRPPVKIQVAGLAQPASTSMLPTSYFQGHWTLVYIAGTNCQADCKAELYAMRQARLATGQHMRQVQRLYVTSGDALPPSGFAANWPGLTVAVATGSAGTRFVQQFSAVHPAGGIYIVDPNGLLMMHFSIHANPEGLLKDLRHLLDVNS
ncbi:MAG: hypothetical protein WCB49_00230 [Gammaproteobacteria bacterium]